MPDSYDERQKEDGKNALILLVLMLLAFCIALVGSFCMVASKIKEDSQCVKECVPTITK